MEISVTCHPAESLRDQVRDEKIDEGHKRRETGGSQTQDLSATEPEKPAGWTPFFYYRGEKEVYNYVGQEIVIKEALDSYAGMIWPAAPSLCHYLETHQDQFNLLDKAVLEIGAGTGLLSVVAALLGAWVTATDLPEVLSNLRVNLSRNTRGRCRHTPQAAPLTWGFDLESTHPSSVYRYDYVLATDVVYHHDFLDDLLATMKHFCRAGTTLIWANKVRFGSDLTFTENFKKTFHTRLLVEDGEMKIFMATCREGEEDEGMKKEEEVVEEESKEEGEFVSDDTRQQVLMPDDKEGEKEAKQSSDDCEENESEEQEQEESKESTVSTTSNNSEKETKTENSPLQKFVPSVIFTLGKDIYHYVGQDIVIYESYDSFGGMMWPAALALCSFLENNRAVINLEGKKVLELGAGTGLVAVVATLLGGSVTATDLPDMVSNLRANVMRNTRGRCRHTPEIVPLSWGFDLELTHPSSEHSYDYVLAADVVYHHDFLDELLATMKHFCRAGTTLIWANKVRFESDLTFTKNFQEVFYTSLLAEDGEMKIFMATSRERERTRLDKQTC